MGLVRANPLPSPAPSVEAAQDPVALRRRAAHELGQTPGSEIELGAQLREETDASVRAALFRGLIAQDSTAAARMLADILRAEDAALRNGALEALAALPGPSTDLLAELLADPDPGQRMFGVLLAGELPLTGVELHLFDLLLREPDVNVCATGLDVLLSMGQRPPARHVETLAQRFRDAPFVQFLLDENDGEGGPAMAPQP